MNWYSAKLIMKTVVRGAGQGSNFLMEESTRIFRAGSYEEAMQKAAEIGSSAEHDYLNDQGELIQWKFLRVEEIQDLCEMEIYDGIEVFSRMVEIEEPAYRAYQI